MIPGLENAEFVRYGVMHRNSFINSPKLLNPDVSLKKNSNIYPYRDTKRQMERQRDKNREKDRLRQDYDSICTRLKQLGF